MFCPQCGQQQVSRETRFCSRCGLPLNLIAEVVANGGTLPVLERLNRKQSSSANRATGLKFGIIWFLTVTFLLTPIFAVIDLDDLVPVTAIVGFIGGILIMVFSLIFLENKPKANFHSNQNQFPQNNPNYLGGNAQTNALPHRQSIPVENYVQPPANSWRDTNDLQPTSITEGTTKLLNDQDLKK